MTSSRKKRGPITPGLPVILPLSAFARHFLRAHTFDASRLLQRATGPVDLCRINSTLSFGLESSPVLFFHNPTLDYRGRTSKGFAQIPYVPSSLALASSLGPGFGRLPVDATALIFCDCEVARHLE